MDAQYYPSRRDFGLGSILWGSLILTLIALVWAMRHELGSPSSMMGLGIMVLTMGFVGVIWFGTGYYLDTQFLRVKVGPFQYAPIPLAGIQEIRRSHSWLSAPANSMTRLWIVYSGGKEIMISPEREGEFIDSILRQNPEVEVKV